MAKSKADKSGTTKATAIREYLEQHPRTKVKEVVVALSERGITVSKNQVYVIKSKGRARRHKAKRMQVAATIKNSGGAITVQLIHDVKSLADRAGGIGKLKELVDVLAK